MDHFNLVFDASCGRSCRGVVTFTGARLLGHLLLVDKLWEQPRPTLCTRQALINIAGGFFAVCHCVGNIGGAGDDIASGVEPFSAGSQRKTVHYDRSTLLDLEA